MAHHRLRVLQDNVQAVVGDVYHKLDERLSQHVALARLQGYSIPCQRGCSHCCRGHLVEISMYEAACLVYAIGALPPQEQKKIWEKNKKARLRLRRLGIAIEEDNDENCKRYDRTKMACPLLDEQNNVCRVYDARPLPCRTLYLANMPASECAKTGNMVTYLDTRLARTRAILQIMQKYVPELSAGTMDEDPLLHDYLQEMLELARPLIEDPPLSFEAWAERLIAEYEARKTAT